MFELVYYHGEIGYLKKKKKLKRRGWFGDDGKHEGGHFGCYCLAPRPRAEEQTRDRKSSTSFCVAEGCVASK